MTHTVRETGNWQHTITIEIPAEDVEARIDRVARDLQRRVALPGFRKGKVPMARVRTDFASHIEQEFLDRVIPEVTGQAIDEAGLRPVVPPRVANVRFTPGQPLSFEAQVDVVPEVEAKDWKGIALVRRTRAFEDAVIDAELEHLREQTAVFTDLERAAARGDVVFADSQRLDANGRRLSHTKSKGVRLELGAPQMLPDLEAGLLGAEAGQERTISVTYPADYPQAELAGHTHRYVVSVRKIQEKKLRALDDTFARELFRLDSLQSLRDRIRQNLEAEDGGRVRRELDSAAVEELIRRNSFELPERLVAHLLDQVIREQSGGRELGDELLKQLREHYRPGVERSIRREVLLGGVARAESLQVSDEEIAAEIDRMCAADPKQAARVRIRYQSAERRHALGEGLLERKAMDAVIAAAQVRDEPIGSPVVEPAH